MFLIHSDQVQAFARKRREAFELESVAFLRAHGLRGVTLDLVRASIDRALARAIETEPEVLQHVAIECRLGDDLAKPWPWVHEILAMRHLTPVGKLRTILRRAADDGFDMRSLDLVDARAR